MPSPVKRRYDATRRREAAARTRAAILNAARDLFTERGYTATPMNLRPEMVWQTKQFEAETPMGRMATVDELVGPAIFLSSQAASFCTGVDLVVDGGFVCW